MNDGTRETIEKLQIEKQRMIKREERKLGKKLDKEDIEEAYAKRMIIVLMTWCHKKGWLMEKISEDVA